MPISDSQRPGNGFRVLLLAIAIAVTAILVTFAIAAACGFADDERWQRGLQELADRHGRMVVAALIGILLALDLVLPLPSSILMMAAGSLLGPTLGTIVGFLGALASACLGFALCRKYGKPAFARICGEVEAERIAGHLERASPWLVLGTRAAPILAEIAACLAGLGKLSWTRFLVLASAGTAPVAAVYAFAGATARDDVGRALAIGIALPIVGFVLGSVLLKRRS